MKWTGLNTLRELYLSFFESKDHLRHKSFPLVPINDKSLLLINAGMTPLKKYFTGQVEPPHNRMTTCQKCIRTPDIERVGLTARHGTFFEMLGNFSFGDYFKNEAIEWAWEFTTKIIELPAELLWVTIYLDDDEAYDIWTKKIGVEPSHVIRLGKEDNFWEHGSGPCGPCSEIHLDRGPEYGCGSPDCKPGCDCDRYIEFWNLVFTQFDGDGNGNYIPLSSPNIDTGMGLERLACLLQGVNNIFEVDTIRNIMLSICEKADVKYGESENIDISFRVITDHIRSTTFLICDGVVPSNEGRGYVLRRLLRRAARHGRLLGIKGLFLSDICDVVAKENMSSYPELTEKLGYIKKIVKIEEERFATTIDSGLEILQNMIDNAKRDRNTMLSGTDIFKLNDTFGFPIDLTREIANEHNLTLDEDGYISLMKEQKDRARKARLAMGDLGWASDSFEFLDKSIKTNFVGYKEVTATSKVIAIIDNDINEEIGTTIPNSKLTIILDTTPFYAESGGQVGDNGIISNDNCVIRVNDTKKHGNIYMHFCEVESGILSTGDIVTTSINVAHRDSIRRNHSVAHLLQGALRKVLGTHVEQAGSYVDGHRVRFDFSHFAAMTLDELTKVEKIVNDSILAGVKIETIETDIDSAKSMGAMALFNEKYGNNVRVVKMGDYSCELCGGTHLDNTAKAGLFKIISESSVAAGVRRIEATSGFGVLALLNDKEALIIETSKKLKVNNPIDIAERASQLQDEIRNMKRNIDSLNSKLVANQISDILKEAIDIGSFKVIAHKTNNMTVESARAICDELKANNENIVAVLSTVNDGKLNFVCVCGKLAVAKGANAGNILKQVSSITGGNGGGRADSATSGGKDLAKVDEALKSVYEIMLKC